MPSLHPPSPVPRQRAHADISTSKKREIKSQNTKHHSRKRNLILPKKPPSPKPQGRHSLRQGRGNCYRWMERTERTQTWQGGWGALGRALDCAKACDCLDGGHLCGPRRLQQSPPKRRKSSQTSPEPTHRHPCSHERGTAWEGEALAAPGKHRLLSTFICYQPAPTTSSSPAPLTATVAGRGLRAGVMARAPHTHAPKRSLKRSNMD